MPKRSKLFTPAHNSPERRKAREQARKAELDRKRPQAHKRGYDWDWRRFRQAILKKQPCCEWCGSTDRLNVDHIKSVSEHPELRLDPNNVRVLCHVCHSRRTAKDQGFARKAEAPA